MVAVEAILGRESPWLVLAVAVLVGGGALLAGRKRVPVSYLRGALAAVITLVAFIGGKYVVAAVLTGQHGDGIRVDNGAGVDGDEEGQEAVPPAAESSRGTDRLVPPGSTAVPGRAALRGTKGDLTAFEIILLGVGAFVAYELGRGAAPRPAAPPASGPLPAHEGAAQIDAAEEPPPAAPSAPPGEPPRSSES
jgi:hypothetical protein